MNIIIIFVIIILLFVLYRNVNETFMLLKNGNIQKNNLELNSSVNLNNSNNISVDRICSTVNGKTICLDESTLQIMKKMPNIRKSSICIGNNNCINKNNIEVLTGNRPMLINTGSKNALTITSLNEVYTTNQSGGSGFFKFRSAVNGNVYIGFQNNRFEGTDNNSAQVFEAIFLNSTGGITNSQGLNSSTSNSMPKGCGSGFGGTEQYPIGVPGKCKVRIALKVNDKFMNVNNDGSVGLTDTYQGNVSAQFWIISFSNNIGIQSISRGLCARFNGNILQFNINVYQSTFTSCQGSGCGGYGCCCCNRYYYNPWYYVNNGWARFEMLETEGSIEKGKIWTPQNVNEKNSSQFLYLYNSQPLPSAKFPKPPKSNIVNNRVAESEETIIYSPYDEERRSTYDTEPGPINL